MGLAVGNATFETVVGAQNQCRQQQKEPSTALSAKHQRSI